MQPLLEISTPPTMKVRQSERDGETVGPSESISSANELLDELEVTNMKKEIGLWIKIDKNDFAAN